MFKEKLYGYGYCSNLKLMARFSDKIYGQVFSTYRGKIFIMKLNAKVYVKYLILKFNLNFKGKFEVMI
jgi:hypothetical protein